MHIQKKAEGFKNRVTGLILRYVDDGEYPNRNFGFAELAGYAVAFIGAILMIANTIQDDEKGAGISVLITLIGLITIIYIAMKCGGETSAEGSDTKAGYEGGVSKNFKDSCKSGISVNNDDECKSEDYKMTVRQGREWLLEYAWNLSDGIQSDAMSKKLLDVLGDIYDRRMAEDEAFYASMHAFLSYSRTEVEKEDFFRTLLYEIVSDGDVEKLYSERDLRS